MAHVRRLTCPATFQGAADECSNVEAVDSSTWLGEALPQGQELYEQVLVQRDVYRLTLLRLSAEDEERDDEERSAWNLRFAYGR